MASEPVSFMLDTNIFNRVVDGALDPRADLPNGARIIGTHIQRDEILATRDASRRAQLLHVFDSFVDERVPTASAVWDVSRWGQAQWGDGLAERLRKALDERSVKRSNVQDSLIAVTAIKRNHVLYSTDRDLVEVTREFGGRAYNPEEDREP